MTGVSFGRIHAPTEAVLPLQGKGGGLEVIIEGTSIGRVVGLRGKGPTWLIAYAVSRAELRAKPRVMQRVMASAHASPGPPGCVHIPITFPCWGRFKNQTCYSISILDSIPLLAMESRPRYNGVMPTEEPSDNKQYCRDYFIRLKADPVRYAQRLAKAAEAKRLKRAPGVSKPARPVTPSSTLTPPVTPQPVTPLEEKAAKPAPVTVTPSAVPVDPPEKPHPLGGKHRATRPRGDFPQSPDQTMKEWHEKWAAPPEPEPVVEAEPSLSLADLKLAAIRAKWLAEVDAHADDPDWPRVKTEGGTP